MNIHPRRSEAAIRNTVLQHTPNGSSRDSVLNFIRTQLHHNDPAIPATFGSKSIEDDVGWYWTKFPLVPMITHVYVSWAFDSHNRLIDVAVDKEVDAP